ncbi:MAG: NAD-dependent epimerase/dehydratase family protein, partial [Chitinophagales bacterium]|nr:NAD-dependent epimerase/dehydratase family protein [Chitinophagales bacterium]
MPKILITGGAGFIASALAERLIQDPANYVVILDNLLTG